MAATTEGALVVTERTNADLSATALEWTVVDMGATGVTSSTASSNAVYGVLTENIADGSSTEAGVSVQLLQGIGRIKLGATLAQGALVRGGTGGKAVTAAPGTMAIGTLRAGGADGEIVACAFHKFQVL